MTCLRAIRHRTLLTAGMNPVNDMHILLIRAWYLFNKTYPLHISVLLLQNNEFVYCLSVTCIPTIRNMNIAHQRLAFRHYRIHILISDSHVGNKVYYYYFSSDLHFKMIFSWFFCPGFVPTKLVNEQTVRVFIKDECRNIRCLSLMERSKRISAILSSAVL